MSEELCQNVGFSGKMNMKIRVHKCAKWNGYLTDDQIRLELSGENVIIFVEKCEKYGENIMQSAIYSIMSAEQWTDFSCCLYTCLDIPVRILNERGECICGQGSTASYCLRFKKLLSMYSYSAEEDSCSALHAQAAKQSMILRKPFIFSCHANLSHLIFPMVREDVPCGSILVGPFLMKKPDIDTVVEVSKRYALSAEDALTLYQQAGSVKILSDRVVEQVCRLLGYALPSLHIDDPELSQDGFSGFQYMDFPGRGSTAQGDRVHDERREFYLAEEEALLIRKIQEYNAEEVGRMLEDLLEHTYSEFLYDRQRCLACATQLCTLLIHAAKAVEPHSEIAFVITSMFMPKLQSIKNPDNMKQQLQEIVTYFEKNIFDRTSDKAEVFRKKAVRYIKENYQTQLTLEKVAGRMMLNPTYFSTLFKQATGSSFKDYLNYVRIEESKKLLTNTGDSILDIALAVGFENQSYFTKVFKKYTGMTPKQYRN